MAFKRNGTLVKHDAAGAAAFWARWYLERENWELGHKDSHQVRLKLDSDEVAEEEPTGTEDTWPPGSRSHH
jgi:hypothetical protein